MSGINEVREIGYETFCKPRLQRSKHWEAAQQTWTNASLLLVRAASEDEGVLTPAHSMEVYGIESIKELRAACDQIIEKQGKLCDPA